MTCLYAIPPKFSVDTILSTIYYHISMSTRGYEAFKETIELHSNNGDA